MSTLHLHFPSETNGGNSIYLRPSQVLNERTHVKLPSTDLGIQRMLHKCLFLYSLPPIPMHAQTPFIR